MGLQNTQNLITDFCRDNTQSILLKQYEKNSRFIIVKCTENGVFKKLDKGTMTCNIKVLTPDDRAIYDPCEILDDGTVKVSVSESMVYAAGVAKAELNIFDDSTATLLATMVFNFIIKPSAYSDDKIIASDEFSALTELITETEKNYTYIIEETKKISDWIAGHENDASAMNSAIQTNKSDISTLQTGKVDKENGKSLLADTDKVNYDDAVSKAHTHDNKSVLDGITSDKVTAWDNKSDFSGNYLDLNNKPTIPKGDGTTITMDDDGTLHGNSSITVDSELSITSINPIQNKIVTQELNKKADSMVYDKNNSKLRLMNGTTILSEIEISGGTGTSRTCINITTQTDSFIGKTVTASSTLETVIGIFGTNSTCSLIVKYIDTYTISCEGYEKTVNVDTLGAVYTVEINSLDLVRFDDETATWEQLNAMAEAYYNDEITLDEIKTYWTVGDMRTISVSAMSATGVGESQSAQDVELVILDFEHDDLTTPINGHTKALVTLQQRDALSARGYINSTDTNSAGWTSSARRTWCNNIYKAALPSDLQAMIKSVNKLTSAGAQSTINTTSDDCFLVSEIEVFGSIAYSAAGEGTQYTYYTTSSNRVKYNGIERSIVCDWWERSPYESDATAFCAVNGEGSFHIYGAPSTCGIAPGFCY